MMHSFTAQHGQDTPFILAHQQSMVSDPRVAQAFDRAAGYYDPSATALQLPVARTLTLLAARGMQQRGVPPHNALDVGCGTGIVLQEMGRHWPQTKLFGLDVSPAMLAETHHHARQALLVQGDATNKLFRNAAFDAVLSSLVLHWARDPVATWQKWRDMVAPEGLLAFSVVLDGSLQEWAQTCAAAGVEHALWPLPTRASLNLPDNAVVSEETRRLIWPSAQAFVQTLHGLGAHVGSRQSPINPRTLRRIFQGSPKPFTVSWRVLYVLMHVRG